MGKSAKEKAGAAKTGQPQTEQPQTKPPETKLPEEVAAVVAAPGGLRLRPVPSKEQIEICVLPCGAVVAGLDTAEGPDGTVWANVRTGGGLNGYVVAEFLKPIDE